jgi:hypothetical protein
MNVAPTSSRAELRRAALRLLEDAVNAWGRPHSFAEAMNPVRPWSASVRVVEQPFAADFTVVEAPTELGRQYECGAVPPRRYVASGTPEYGTYYGTLFQVVREGQPAGVLVLVWRRVDGEWRIVAYRTVE